ncbi:MAG: hypothetical protein ACP5G0_03555 [Desulfomonilia bacterium]
MMPEKGIKKQSGKTKERTVLALTPVKYMISLQYIGEGYVKRDNDKYRCTYEMKKDAGASMENVLLTECIPNVVSGNEVDDASKDAATPGKEKKNPAADQVFRLLVTDNHTLSENDWRLLGNSGNPNGDKVSRVDYYKRSNRKWMKDVQPAAPFRVIVRKFQGFEGNEVQVDLEETLKVVVEVKDPVEETAVHAAGDGDAVKNFLKEFYTKYNRTDSNPTAGDDNCPDYFKGHRKPSDSNPGVQASKVIKKAPFIDTFADPTMFYPEDLEFKKISSVGSYKKKWVKLDINNEEMFDGGKFVTIGITDFIFSPLPVGGDNYRFLVWLVNGKGKDIRETTINGAEIDLLDDQKKVIPRPRAYCTGRFVIWRRVDIRLLLTANTLPAGNISWNTVKGYYEHAFTEIHGPTETKALPLAGWRQSLIDVFNSGNETGDYANWDNFRPAGKTDADPEYNDIYAVGLFPAFMNPANRTSEDAQNLCNDILKKAVQALDPVQNPPLTAEKRNVEKTGEGIYMLYARCNGGGLLGCWLGDGKLFVSEHTGVYAAETNETTTHEMAHGLFLRHSNTSTQRRWDSGANDWVSFTVEYEDAGGNKKNIQLIDPCSNCFPEDHDQLYAFKCTMSYLQEQHFCGVCALTLRFYDRIKVQDSKRFQDRIMKGFFDDVGNAANDAKVVYLEYNGANPNDLKLHETIPNMAVGGEMLLMAVGPEHAYVAAGSNEEGRVNLSCAHKKPKTLWRSSNTSVLSFEVVGTICIQVKAKKTGTSTITYSRNGKLASATITVA